MVVLFGKPKSGTSMMMRVLKLGGIPIEYVEGTPSPRWAARYPHGKFETITPTLTQCFKCVRPALLDKLPADTKVIHIKRDEEQIWKAWRVILHGPVCDYYQNNSPKVTPLFEQALARKTTVLTVQYTDMFSDTANQCQRIKEFVAAEFPAFDAVAAATAVDKALYVVR